MFCSFRYLFSYHTWLTVRFFKSCTALHREDEIALTSRHRPVSETRTLSYTFQNRTSWPQGTGGSSWSQYFSDSSRWCGRKKKALTSCVDRSLSTIWDVDLLRVKAELFVETWGYSNHRVVEVWMRSAFWLARQTLMDGILFLYVENCSSRAASRISQRLL